MRSSKEMLEDGVHRACSLDAAYSGVSASRLVDRLCTVLEACAGIRRRHADRKAQEQAYLASLRGLAPLQAGMGPVLSVAQAQMNAQMSLAAQMQAMSQQMNAMSGLGPYGGLGATAHDSLFRMLLGPR